MTGLLVLYTVNGLGRIERGRTTRSYSQEIWMSRVSYFGATETGKWRQEISAKPRSVAQR
jgi:hypothetical protein